VTAPFNLDMPLRIGADRRFASAEYADHVRDMIRAFLFTKAGERVMRYDYGSGLFQLAFSPNSPELAAALQLTGRAGLERWLGDIIEIRSFEASADEAALKVTMVYALRPSDVFVEEDFERDKP